MPRGVGDGRSAVCGLLRARESGFREASPVAQRAAGAGHARQESHRVAARGRVALTVREARRSPVIDRAAGAKEAVGSYGHSVRLHCQLSTNAPPAKAPQPTFRDLFSTASRAPARTTRRRPAHRASSLGRHGRLTELRPTRRRRRPRLGASPPVSRASLSARHVRRRRRLDFAKARVASRHPRR